MQSKLASLKNKLLNKAGRLTIASSVFSSIPSYYMQIVWMPQRIFDSIDQTTRNFTWKDANNKGINLVGWNEIARPKYQGGLGIRTTREVNICLLGKLVWDMVRSSNKLWVDFLSDKYVVGPRLLYATTRPTDSSTWFSIIRAKNSLKASFSWCASSSISSFWYYPCSTLGYLGTLIPYVDIHLTVKDVISYNNPHTQVLYTPLPPIVSNTINNMHFK